MNKSTDMNTWASVVSNTHTKPKSWAAVIMDNPSPIKPYKSKLKPIQYTEKVINYIDLDIDSDNMNHYSSESDDDYEYTPWSQGEIDAEFI